MKKLKLAINGSFIYLLLSLIILSACNHAIDESRDSNNYFDEWVTKVGGFGTYMTDYKDVVIILDKDQNNDYFYDYLTFWDIGRFPIDQKPIEIDESIFSVKDDYIRIVETNGNKYIMASPSLSGLDTLYEEIIKK